MQTIGKLEIDKSVFDNLIAGKVLRIDEDMTCKHIMREDEIMDYGAKRAFQFQSTFQRAANEQKRQYRKTLQKHFVNVLAVFYKDIEKKPGHHRVKIYYDVKVKGEKEIDNGKGKTNKA